MAWGFRLLCAKDVVLYFDLFVWQYNPKADPEVGPFVTFPFQEDVLCETVARWIKHGKDILWEKSREMGASWMALGLSDWCCLFHDWKKFLAVSHSEMAVDRGGDPDSLFWKVKFMHDHLPAWLRGDVHKRKLGFAYRTTHSAFTGAASTGRSGVGGRGNVLLDELGKQEAAQDIVGQTADTGPRLFISTHYGIGTTFYDLTIRPDLFKIVMHWSQHPERRKGLYRYHPDKGFEVLDKEYQFPADYQFVTDGSPTGGPYPGLRSPWYDEECRRRHSARDVAMHLDIDPQGSVSQFFDPLQISRLQQQFSCPPWWEGDFQYDAESARPSRLVARKGGLVKLWVNLAADGKPPPGVYAMGLDISTGNGTTNSCLSIIDRRRSEKVLEYADPNIRPEHLAVFAVALAWLFKDANGDGALMIWEAAGPGDLFGKTVVELDFWNFFWRRNEQKAIDDSPLEIPGWYPTPKNRRALLDDYRAALYERQLLNRSFEALEECRAFRYTVKGVVEHSGEQSQKDPSGARENHGDRVIADALAWKVSRGEEQAQVPKEKEDKRFWHRSLAGRRWFHDAMKRDEEILDRLVGW